MCKVKDLLKGLGAKAKAIQILSGHFRGEADADALLNATAIQIGFSSAGLDLSSYQIIELMSELEGSDEDCNETTYFEFKTFFKSLSSRVMERRCKNTVLNYAAELRA